MTNLLGQIKNRISFSVCVGVFALLAAVVLPGCNGPRSLFADDINAQEDELKVATFGAGCFWCVEAVFQQLEGVSKVESGYSGGATENPSYKDVCSGKTGHAEVCQIHYDPDKISFEELLEVLWKSHDPTTKDKQGNDEGSQYRSAIFYHDQEQKQLAEKYKNKLEDAKVFNAPIVTEITEFTKFYPADQSHQEYFLNNPNAGYCRAVIQPKVAKIREVFADKLKKDK